MKKRVIAYLHTHWDREWYREFEVFRLRLLRVFDNVLELLEQNKIPAFYFDGQVSALLDYLELRPEKEKRVRKFIKDKRLFIGPFYTLADEFLTDEKCLEKNLEIGLKISKEFGCEDFIGYLADTFGHSQNIPKILKKHGINKCAVWRGCGDIPSEFIFNGINTVNLVRGYFMDIFSADLTIEKKAEWLKENLDKISEKSGKLLLLPIGADHLGIEKDITEQINQVNKILKDYEIKLSTPFEYFELVKNNFKYKWNNELRDNSKTFILQGCYSARTRIKRENIIASYKLHFADELQKNLGEKYSAAIEYGYKLLLKNQAHDGICGCSTDDVHQENMTRYTKVIQIADTILKELKFLYPKEYDKLLTSHNKKYRSVMEFESKTIPEKAQVIDKRKGFADTILYDTQKIPITEDYTTIYRCLKEIKTSNNNFKEELLKAVKIKNNKIVINNIDIDFVRYIDKGDTYNFGAVKNDKPEIAKISGTEIIQNGELQTKLKIKTSFFDVILIFEKGLPLIKFEINWNNRYKNKLWQVRFNLKDQIKQTYSEDMNSLITRDFDSNYDMRKHLPKTKGIEVKTNFTPMQRYVGTKDFGIITIGLTEYEVFKNALSVTLLRSTGIISNPKNPSRSTPAGPPIEVPQAQQLGQNTAEFAIGFFEPKNYKNYLEAYYAKLINGNYIHN